MSESIYGLHCDFVYRGGHFIEVSGPQMQSGQVCKLELNMLEHNDVPSLLPLKVEEIDFQLKLYYPLSGMRRLSEHLRIVPPDLEQYFRILHQIVLALEQAADYMLTENNHVLSESYIFVQPDYEEIGLLYLPLKQIQKPDWREELSTLAVSMLEHVQQVSGDGVQTILRTLKDPSCTLTQLIQLLEKQLESLQKGDASSSGRLKPEHGWLDANTEIDVNREIDANTEPEMTEPVTAAKEDWLSDPAPRILSDGTRSHQKVFRFANHAFSAYLFAGLALLILAALLTRLYLAFPGRGLLYTVIAIFLCAVAGACLYLIRQRSLKQKGELHDLMDGEPLDSWELIDESSLTDAGSRWKPLGNDNIPDDDPNPAGDVNASDHTENYYRTLPEHTTLLRNPEATSWLRPADHSKSWEETEESDQSARAIRAYLEWSPEDHVSQATRYVITRQRVVIGRDSERADLVYPRPGISRAHAELIQEEDDFYLVDLGSKNGTWINGVPAAAYKRYPLADGDRLRFAHDEMIFRLLKSSP